MWNSGIKYLTSTAVPNKIVVEVSMTYFGKQLAELMDEHEIYNQIELAEKIGVRQSTISNWLHGKSLPNYHQIGKLCKVFNVSADALCDTSFDD